MTNKAIVTLQKMKSYIETQEELDHINMAIEAIKEKVSAENAIRTFLECLAIERKDKTTRKPISRALYRTWRYYNSIERERGGRE